MFSAGSFRAQSWRYCRSARCVGSIHRALEWNRAFILSCDTFACVASDAECRIDFIYGGDKHPSPDSQTWSVRKNNRKERVMLKESKAFSGFSTADITKAKEFYAGTLPPLPGSRIRQGTFSPSSNKQKNRDASTRVRGKAFSGA